MGCKVSGLLVGEAVTGLPVRGFEVTGVVVTGVVVTGAVVVGETEGKFVALACIWAPVAREICSEEMFEFAGVKVR